MTTPTQTPDQTTSPKSMDDLVALCKRRGFIFQASEIYGGLNGFWDYGPLGTALKNNLRDAWWNDMVVSPPMGPDGQPVSILGLDSSIIQHPRVWEASGHVGGFNDPMVDCKACKSRFRADHLSDSPCPMKPSKLVGEFDKCELTEPRDFNLMFFTYCGAIFNEENKTYLRPETAQGIFLNYKNVLDTMRVKVPFGIAQIGKAFRNEVTPRNFIFRSREFEQMEIEFFCHPDEKQMWYDFWCETRKNWWHAIGLTGENIQMRQHENDELAHYAKEGCGCFDVEYRFPFTFPGFGELEGVADRTDYDLKKHQEYSKQKLEYFDQEAQVRAKDAGLTKEEIDAKSKYMPHVIEPSAGLSRGVLAVLCEAFTPTPDRKGSKYIMKFHPRLAPIQAAVFPLVAKDGMPEKAQGLYDDLRNTYKVQMDAKQSIGKRYARMDEVGTPFCFTIDGDTLDDDTVTVRDRDTASQERINISQVRSYLAERIG